MSASRHVRNLFDLEGKVSLVTGGGRGLGKIMAAGLAEAGSILPSPDGTSKPAGRQPLNSKKSGCGLYPSNAI